jgi:hypothetical protein
MPTRAQRDFLSSLSINIFVIDLLQFAIIVVFLLYLKLIGLYLCLFLLLFLHLLRAIELLFRRILVINGLFERICAFFHLDVLRQMPHISDMLQVPLIRWLLVRCLILLLVVNNIL